MRDEFQEAREIIEGFIFSVHDRISRNEEAIGNLTRGQDEQNAQLADLQKEPGQTKISKSLEETNEVNLQEAFKVYAARFQLVEKICRELIKTMELLNENLRTTEEHQKECWEKVKELHQKINGPEARLEKERYQAGMEIIDRREKDLDKRLRTLEEKEIQLRQRTTDQVHRIDVELQDIQTKVDRLY